MLKKQPNHKRTLLINQFGVIKSIPAGRTYAFPCSMPAPRHVRGPYTYRLNQLRVFVCWVFRTSLKQEQENTKKKKSVVFAVTVTSQSSQPRSNEIYFPEQLNLICPIASNCIDWFTFLYVFILVSKEGIIVLCGSMEYTDPPIDKYRF